MIINSRAISITTPPNEKNFALTLPKHKQFDLVVQKQPIIKNMKYLTLQVKEVDKVRSRHIAQAKGIKILEIAV